MRNNHVQGTGNKQHRAMILIPGRQEANKMKLMSVPTQCWEEVFRPRSREGQSSRAPQTPPAEEMGPRV